MYYVREMHRRVGSTPLCGSSIVQSHGPNSKLASPEIGDLGRGPFCPGRPASSLDSGGNNLRTSRQVAGVYFRYLYVLNIEERTVGFLFLQAEAVKRAKLWNRF